MIRKHLLALLLCLHTGVAYADFNDGVVALMEGKYDKALQVFLPLAQTSEHAFAQYFLGAHVCSRSGRRAGR